MSDLFECVGTLTGIAGCVWNIVDWFSNGLSVCSPAPANFLISLGFALLLLANLIRFRQEEKK